MDSNFSTEKRVIVYIDGFNLYYGIKGLQHPEFKWLDVEKLAQNFMRPRMNLLQIKYFTSIIRGQDQDAQVRQQIYLEALAINSEKLTIKYGHFLRKRAKCKNCNCYNKTFEEKKTDVNIACDMLIDAYEDSIDIAILISGDSDLSMPVQQIIKLGKTVLVAFPPKRSSQDLKNKASGSFSINPNMLKKALLPAFITKKNGSLITQPAIWQVRGFCSGSFVK